MCNYMFCPINSEDLCTFHDEGMAMIGGVHTNPGSEAHVIVEPMVGIDVVHRGRGTSERASQSAAIAA